MERQEDAAKSLHEHIQTLIEEMTRLSGIPPEVLDAMEREAEPDHHNGSLQRKGLVQGRVATTGLLESYLPLALERVLEIAPAKWLDAEAGTDWRLTSLIRGEECLSLVKGLRAESEFPGIHRMRQALRVTKDYVDGHLAFDHFAGSTLAPQIAQLGSHLDYLSAVGGDLDSRISRLWNGPSESVDASLFELLVAAGCSEYGRQVEFLPETQDKSPDLRCHDPYPMVIECKRKRALSRYEQREEKAMRQLFVELEKQALGRGLYGRFDLLLKVEADQAPVQEIVSRMISQRLAAHPDRELNYEWGSVAYNELTYRVRLPDVTRTYSPNMLMALFGWDSDLPEWDGIVCRVDVQGEPSVDEVRGAVALVWSNMSERAVRKRAWSPLDLFGDAMNQITPGEFGLIYLCYIEGAREAIADKRVSNFLSRMPEWEHSAAIRVPISFLVRLYPRPLNDGNPDLIESTVRLISGEYGEPSLFEEFPNSIFVRPPGRPGKGGA